MLDVHAPEHIGGLRDFMIHLLTITVGLLIALGLENAAEAMHHGHQRREAEELIRQELEDNRHQLQQAETDIETETKNMVLVLDFLEARLASKPGNPDQLSLNYHEGPLEDSAWLTASSTGAVSYMPYSEVQKFALAYKEQALFETMQEKTLDEYLQLDAFVVKGFDPSHITASDLQAALPIVRQALAHLRGMSDVEHGAIKAYDQALQ